MKSLSKLIFALFFVAGSASAQTVDDVIARHIEASGGSAKMAAFKTMKMTASLDMMSMKIPIITTVVDRKSSRTEATVNGMTQIIVVDGTSGWFIDPFQGKQTAEKVNEEMVKQAKEEQDLSGPLYNYKTKGNKVELVGKEEMEGTDVYKLKVTRPSGDVSYMFIDASSYLLLKETSKQKFKDKEVQSEKLYSNYKKVDGINVPHTVEVREEGQSTGQIITVENVQINPKVDDSIFKMPPAPAK